MTTESFGANAGRPATGYKCIQKPKLLLGEGVDEERFFSAMLKYLGREDVQVLSYGGKRRLPDTLGVLMRDPMWPDVETVLITRDADFAAEGSGELAARIAWTSITNTLRLRGLPVPKTHAELQGGEERSAGTKLRVGVFILPDGVSDGMLEDLCLAAVAGDPVMHCLDAYFACIEEQNGPIPGNVLPKARAHAYLASRPVPDRRVGEAAVAGDWPWGAPAFAQLLAFLRSA